MNVEVGLRWGDMDAFGHINNVMYLRLIEEARVALFTRPIDDNNGTLMDTGLLVVRSEIDYLRPMDYRSEPITIQMWVTELGGSSFDLQYVVQDGPTVSEPVEYAHAETTLVLFDLETQRPRRLREPERATLGAWADDEIEFRGAKRKRRRWEARKAAQ